MRERLVRTSSTCSSPMEPQESLKPEVLPQDRLEAALGDPDLARVYVNSFLAFSSNADVGVILEHTGKPAALLNMSYTLAKTLSEKLGEIIASIEQQTGREIMTTSFIDTARAEVAGDDE